MPHRLMRLILDPAHLELPGHVVGAIASTVGALALAVWQWIGAKIAQLPTPDKVTGWQERDIYLCTAIFAVAGIIVLLRWIATKWMVQSADSTQAIREMTASNTAVATALTELKNSITGIALHAVEQAVQNAVPTRPENPLAAPQKRG